MTTIDHVLQDVLTHHHVLQDAVVIGVYAGFDQASRRAGRDVALALEERGYRVVPFRPMAVSPIGEVTEKVRRRLLAAAQSRVDVVIDASPRARAEARLLAAALGAPHVALAEGLPGEAGEGSVSS